MHLLSMQLFITYSYVFYFNQNLLSNGLLISATAYLDFDVSANWLTDSSISVVAGMKYDLRKVEEVFYDVKIRGLAANGESAWEKQAQGQSWIFVHWRPK